LADKGGLDYDAIMQSAALEFVSITHLSARFAAIKLQNVSFIVLCLIYRPHRILKLDLKEDEMVIVNMNLKR
jgi:hypothetical protein